MNTKLAYFEDCYLRELKAKVTSVQENVIEFDSTIFYPEGGGQVFDTGTIEWNGNKSKVIEVRKKDGKILHKVEGIVPKVNDIVLQKIDWERRYKIMRMHTAQHLLSSIVLDNWNAETAGNQIHEDVSRMDFSPIKFSEEMIKQIEKEFNAKVLQKIPVKIYITSREKMMQEVDEKRRTLFARMPESLKEVRVIEIQGIDKCPCGGTHISSTSEIGLIKITGRV